MLDKVAMAEMFEMSDEQKRNLAKCKIYFRSNFKTFSVSGRNLRKALLQAEIMKVKGNGARLLMIEKFI